MGGIKRGRGAHINFWHSLQTYKKDFINSNRISKVDYNDITRDENSDLQYFGYVNLVPISKCCEGNNS